MTRLEYAENQLQEAIDRDVDFDIHYWRGYRDCAKRYDEIAYGIGKSTVGEVTCSVIDTQK